MIISLDPTRHVTGFMYEDGTRAGIINTVYHVDDIDKTSEFYQEFKNNYPMYIYDKFQKTYTYDNELAAQADWSLTADDIRDLRETECFKYINRGPLWETLYAYDLTRITQLREWYVAWLNAPITHVIPERPSWIK